MSIIKRIGVVLLWLAALSFLFAGSQQERSLSGLTAWRRKHRAGRDERRASSSF